MEKIKVFIVFRIELKIFNLAIEDYNLIGKNF
jgi:hypothetical protein